MAVHGRAWTNLSNSWRAAEWCFSMELQNGAFYRSLFLLWLNFTEPCMVWKTLQSFLLIQTSNLPNIFETGNPTLDHKASLSFHHVNIDISQAVLSFSLHSITLNSTEAQFSCSHSWCYALLLGIFLCMHLDASSSIGFVELYPFFFSNLFWILSSISLLLSVT